MDGIRYISNMNAYPRLGFNNWRFLTIREMIDMFYGGPSNKTLVEYARDRGFAIIDEGNFYPCTNLPMSELYKWNTFHYDYTLPVGFQEWMYGPHNYKFAGEFLRTTESTRGTIWDANWENYLNIMVARDLDPYEVDAYFW